MRLKGRLKTIAAALMVSTALSTPARADPITTIVGIISSGLNAIGASVATQAIVGQAIIGFTSSALGSALLTAGLSFAANALLAQQPPAPRPQDLQANFTLDQKDRYYASGELRLGGGVSFAEAKDGRLYKQIYHADAEVTEDTQLYLNDIPVTLDGDVVTTDEYVVDDEHYFHLWTRPGTIHQAAQAKLVADFPEWTPQHVGAGVSDTLMMIESVPTKKRASVYNHRGCLGLGEPDITRVARYGRYYDPRKDSTRGGNGPQRADDPSTWGPSLGNLALLIAQHRIDRERFAMDPEDINWENIAEQADICDEIIIDRYGQEIPRYRGAVLINKGQESNIDAENRMLAACDGIRFEDEDGRFGIFVGKYVEPEVVLTDADIFDIESSETEDGETQYSHVYGLYTEPAFAYKESSTAVYVNPDLWKEGDPVTTNKLDLHILLDHNTTFRVVKATSLRQSAKRALAITAGLRAKKLRKYRFCRLNLSDANLSGVYEVASLAPAEDGLANHIVLISTGANNWTLLPGEEGERPNFNTTVTVDKDIANIAAGDMQFTSETITGAGVRIVANFPVPSRPDRIVQIQYRRQGETIWQEFSVRTEDGEGTSGAVDTGDPYELQWRVTTISGGSSPWANIVTFTPTADTTPPAAPNSFGVVLDGSTVDITWRNPNDPRFAAARLFRGASDVFDDATDLVGPVYGSPNQIIQTTDSPGTGTWFYWVVSESASAADSDPVGPETVTIA